MLKRAVSYSVTDSLQHNSYQSATSFISDSDGVVFSISQMEPRSSGDGVVYGLCGIKFEEYNTDLYIERVPESIPQVTLEDQIRSREHQENIRAQARSILLSVLDPVGLDVICALFATQGLIAMAKLAGKDRRCLSIVFTLIYRRFSNGDGATRLSEGKRNTLWHDCHCPRACGRRSSSFHERLGGDISFTSSSQTAHTVEINQSCH